MSSGAASATSPRAARAARELFEEEQASAVDAVLAGWLAEAGEHEDVLLAPFAALVFGTGAGAKAYDARALQPGAGADRPRGIAEGEPIPDAARAAVSRSVVTAALMHTERGRVSMRAVAARGVEAAREVGALRRAALIDDVGQAKATALGREPIVEALLAVGGKLAGGALTRSDLAILPAALDAAVTKRADARLVRVPWSIESAPGSEIAGTTEIIAAADAWGLLAVLAYHRAGSIDVPGLQIGLPRSGTPVMRGVQRIAPGTPIASPGPIAIVDRGGAVALALGAKRGPGIDEEAGSEVRGPLMLDDELLAPLAGAPLIDGAVRDLGAAARAAIAAVAIEPRGPRAVGHAPA